MKISHIVISVLFSSLGLFAQIVPNLGDGTEANPYQIANLDNLRWLSETSSVLSKHFIQTADIDASSTSTWNSGKGFDPLINFTGVYNGNSKTISNLFINRSTEYNVGLFGYACNAVLKNISVVDLELYGKYYSGGIVGNSEANELSYCNSSGNINSSGSFSGGISGYSSSGSSYSNCSSSVNVTATGSYLGGLIGYLNSGLLENCYTAGSVSNPSGY